MVVIDEAHCISVWDMISGLPLGRIINLVRLLPAGLPVWPHHHCNQEGRGDVASQIGGNIKVLRGNLMRENFRLYVVKLIQRMKS